MSEQDGALMGVVERLGLRLGLVRYLAHACCGCAPERVVMLGTMYVPSIVPYPAEEAPDAAAVGRKDWGFHLTIGRV